LVVHEKGKGEKEYRRKKMPGFVYAFVTPSMPGVVKIGATEREVTESLAAANSWALSYYAIA
jgi:hypothetical protein